MWGGETDGTVGASVGATTTTTGFVETLCRSRSRWGSVR